MAGRSVSYLGEAVRLGGTERLVGHLQQLLRTLQGFGAGAQLTLRKTWNRSQTEYGVCKLSHNGTIMFSVELAASFESHGCILRLQRAGPIYSIRKINSCELSI